MIGSCHDILQAASYMVNACRDIRINGADVTITYARDQNRRSQITEPRESM